MLRQSGTGRFAFRQPQLSGAGTTCVPLCFDPGCCSLESAQELSSGGGEATLCPSHRASDT